MTFWGRRHVKFIVFLISPRGGTYAPSFTARNGIKRDETSCKSSTDGGSNAQRTCAKDYTVDSRLSARCLTALRLNRGNVFLKIFFFQWVSHLFKCFVWQSMLVYYNLERTVLAFTSSIDILPLFFLKARNQVSKARNLPFFQQVENVKEPWPARSHKSVWCETSISKGTNKDQTQAPVNL